MPVTSPLSMGDAVRLVHSAAAAARRGEYISRGVAVMSALHFSTSCDGEIRNRRCWIPMCGRGFTYLVFFLAEVPD
jgi:hypothetical protein